jgi:ectoine hydroxylase-related dioxygenase (phytanoyl-CoA dioxygenase family)
MERSAIAAPAGVCGDLGYHAPVLWSPPDEARALAARLELQAGTGNVTANPHLREDWARDLVRSPALVGHVLMLIGADVAVENTYLMVKRPGDGFAVPPHQDGINDRIELDPDRSVAFWVAITEATPVNGCLEVVPGSHSGGYLPYQRAGGGPLSVGEHARTGEWFAVPLEPGQATALDVRLIHRSGPNAGDRPRIGLNIRYVAPGGLSARDGEPPSLFPVAGARW